MFPTDFTLTQPDWAEDELAQLPAHLPTLEARMAAVIRFSRLNFERGTGGPFAAGVFERDSGRLIVIGVNRVLASGISSAHAEVMALGLAQRALNTWDLGAAHMPAYQLVVNWLPCAMCYGAALWSGIRELAIAGHGSELEQLTGFDEGPRPASWRDELERRGVRVIDDVLRNEAIAVFRDFGASNALVYNGRGGGARPLLTTEEDV
jgi:tRNA(Arg) A34 adenosine deaminase TadA